MNTIPPEPPPAPDRPTRDSSRKQHESKPNRIWQAILSFIDWLNGLAGKEKTRVNNTADQEIEDDPLEFLGEWVSTRFAMGAGDFRYGSRFYIESYNKRKKCYTAHCPPMGSHKIKLSVQTLIDFEASANKPKNKTNGEQMVSIEELFEGYEDVDRERGDVDRIS